MNLDQLETRLDDQGLELLKSAVYRREESHHVEVELRWIQRDICSRQSSLIYQKNGIFIHGVLNVRQNLLGLSIWPVVEDCGQVVELCPFGKLWLRVEKVGFDLLNAGIKIFDAIYGFGQVFQNELSFEGREFGVEGNQIMPDA